MLKTIPIITIIRIREKMQPEPPLIRSDRPKMLVLAVFSLKETYVSVVLTSCWYSQPESDPA